MTIRELINDLLKCENIDQECAIVAIEPTIDIKSKMFISHKIHVESIQTVNNDSGTESVIIYAK